MPITSPKVKSIDRKTKTVEFDDGKILPLPEDLAFEILGSEAAKQKTTGIKEATVELNKSFPLGKEAGAAIAGAGQGSAFANLATKYLGDPLTESFASIKKGPGQENMSFFERLSENLQAVGRGRREGKAEIARENPKSFLGGQIGGIGVDLGVPLPKAIPRNPIAQGAILGGAFGAGSGEESLLTEPGTAGKEILKGAALGAGIGAVGGKLEKIAQQRGALRKYPEILQRHKEATTQAEKKFLTEMATGLDKVETQLTGSGIPKDSLSIQEFINKELGTSAIAGTPQARNLTSFFESLGASAPNHLNAPELKNLFSAIEGRIATGAAEDVPFLTSFRQHLVRTIPEGAANAAVKKQYGTRLLQAFDKEVDSAINSFLSDKKMLADLKNTEIVQDSTLNSLGADIKRFVKSGYDKMTPAEFVNDVKTGNFQNRLMWFFDNNKKLQDIGTKIDSTIQKFHQIGPIENLRSPVVNNILKAKDELVRLREGIENKVAKAVKSNASQASQYETKVADTIAKSLSDAVGEVNPRAIHTQPRNARPLTPVAPTPPAVGRTAQFLETPDFYGTQAKRLLNLKGSSGLAKMGYLATGLPGIKGAAVAATGVGGLTAALRGATSPTALGSFARSAIQKGGMRMIVDSIANTYPSYQNGVLQDPQDRRSAAAQIEQDQDISLENKAMLQTKINRGVNLETLIKDEE